MDTILSALPSLPAHKANKAPQAFLAYAEIELQSNLSESLDRALHVLCSLPEGGIFCPLPSKKSGKKLPTTAATVPAVTPARIKQCQAGYQGLLEAVLCGTPPGIIGDDTGVAIVACTALFNYLTRGLAAASAVYTQVIGLVPEELQKTSAWYEMLHLRRIALVQAATRKSQGQKQQSSNARDAVTGGSLGGSSQAHEEHTGPSHVLALLTEALALYPTNPRLLARLMAMEAECSAWARLRRSTDVTIKKHPGA